MDGEFRIKLKAATQDEIAVLFKKKYQDKLTDAFQKSAYATSNRMKEKDFCAGYHNNNSLFLVYTLESNTMKVYVENTNNNKDLNLLKSNINMYFQQVIDMLDKNKDKWSEPEASISLEDCPFYGFVQTRGKRLKEILDNQWEKLIIVPVASILASFIAIKLNLLSAEESTKDIKKAVILTTEAYLGLVIVLLIKVVIKVNKKEFTFKI